MRIERLREVEQGMVMGALLDRPRSDAWLRRLFGPARDRCLEAHAEIAQLEPPLRRQRIRAISRRLFNPIPHHLEQIDPTWVQRLLEREPIPVIQAALSVLPRSTAKKLMLPAVPSRGPVLSAVTINQIFRHLLGPLESMSPVTSAGAGKAPPRRLEDLERWPAARLEGALMHAGCLVVASALRHAGPALRDQVLEKTDLACRKKLALACDTSVPLPSFPIHELRSRLVPPAIDPKRLLRIGGRALAATLTLRTRRRLAQRLTRELGESLLHGRDRPGATDPPDPGASRQALRLIRLADDWARTGKLC